MSTPNINGFHYGSMNSTQQLGRAANSTDKGVKDANGVNLTDGGISKDDAKKMDKIAGNGDGILTEEEFQAYIKKEQTGKNAVTYDSSTMATLWSNATASTGITSSTNASTGITTQTQNLGTGHTIEMNYKTDDEGKKILTSTVEIKNAGLKNESKVIVSYADDGTTIATKETVTLDSKGNETHIIKNGNGKEIGRYTLNTKNLQVGRSTSITTDASTGATTKTAINEAGLKTITKTESVDGGTKVTVATEYKDKNGDVKTKTTVTTTTTNDDGVKTVLVTDGAGVQTSKTVTSTNSAGVTTKTEYGATTTPVRTTTTDTDGQTPPNKRVTVQQGDKSTVTLYVGNSSKKASITETKGSGSSAVTTTTTYDRTSGKLDKIETKQGDNILSSTTYATNETTGKRYISETKTTDKKGNVTVKNYNDSGKIKQETYTPADSTKQATEKKYSYDANGNLIQISENNAGGTADKILKSVAYDTVTVGNEACNRTTTIVGDKKTVEIKNSAGKLISKQELKDPNGDGNFEDAVQTKLSTFTYDEKFGRKLTETVTTPNKNDTTKVNIKQLEYKDSGYANTPTRIKTTTGATLSDNGTFSGGTVSDQYYNIVDGKKIPTEDPETGKD